jgi:hypothetical protein
VSVEQGLGGVGGRRAVRTGGGRAPDPTVTGYSGAILEAVVSDDEVIGDRTWRFVSEANGSRSCSRS